MSRSRTIGLLLVPEPIQWGLRGDPHLWREMWVRLGDVPAPGSVEELVALIEREFEVLTGHCMSEQNHFYVERFNHGGMSGGGISPKFWREQAMPLLRERFQAGREA